MQMKHRVLLRYLSYLYSTYHVWICDIKFFTKLSTSASNLYYTIKCHKVSERCVQFSVNVFEQKQNH